MYTPVDYVYRDDKGIQHGFGHGQVELEKYYVLPKEVYKANYAVISGTYDGKNYTPDRIIQWSVGVDIHVETIPLERRKR